MIIGRAIMALPIIFVAVLNFDSPYYRSADSAIRRFSIPSKERRDVVSLLFYLAK